MSTVPCVVCTKAVGMDEEQQGPPLCGRCSTYPSALIKACHDPFDYACRLTTGEVIRFEIAVMRSRDWFELCPASTEAGFHSSPRPKSFPGHELFGLGVDYNFPRGIEVHLSHIVWIADAPAGS